jgi:hypothetical protein
MDEAYLAYLQKFKNGWRGGNHALVFAQPKSASTYFANVLAKSMGVDLVFYENKLSGPNRLSVFEALAQSGQDAVARTHSENSFAAQVLINGLEARPIVITRDVADSIVSMVDHRAYNQSTSADADLVKLDTDTQIRITAYEWVARFIAFQSSWQELRANERYLFLDFAEIAADPVGAINRALAHLRVTADPATIERSIAEVAGNRKLSNKNVGATGRGARLPDDILKMIDTYRSFMEQGTVSV